MKLLISSISRIFTLFLLVFALDGLLGVHLMDVECSERAETDIEFLEEIEEGEEHRAHWKPKVKKTMGAKGSVSVWTLLATLLHRLEVLDGYSESTHTVCVHYHPDERVVLGHETEVYLFFGDSSPPHHS